MAIRAGRGRLLMSAGWRCDPGLEAVRTLEPNPILPPCELPQPGAWLPVRLEARARALLPPEPEGTGGLVWSAEFRSASLEFCWFLALQLSRWEYLVCRTFQDHRVEIGEVLWKSRFSLYLVVFSQCSFDQSA